MTGLKLVPPDHCPTCGQRIKPHASRVCADCGKAILRHHRFYFDGSTVRHKNCAEPTSPDFPKP